MWKSEEETERDFRINRETALEHSIQLFMGLPDVPKTREVIDRAKDFERYLNEPYGSLDLTGSDVKIDKAYPID